MGILIDNWRWLAAVFIACFAAGYCYRRVNKWLFPRCFVCGKKFRLGDNVVYCKGTPRHHFCDRLDPNYVTPTLEIWFQSKRDEDAFNAHLSDKKRNFSFFMIRKPGGPPTVKI